MIILIVIIILIICYYQYGPRFTEVSDILSYNFNESDAIQRKKISMVTNPEKDVKLEEYGCFENLDEKFFYKKINPYSDIKAFDSVFAIDSYSDLERLFDQVSKNGFGDYISKLKSKYPPSSSGNINLTLQELGALALLSGYSYISVYKIDPKTFGTILLSYSPPMNKHNIYGTFDSKEFDKFISRNNVPLSLNGSSSKESCGYRCDTTSDYYCGSVTYPYIKSPIKYAVYKVIETI